MPSLQFFGDGFLKYKLRSDHIFRKVKFSFKTLQKDALLLYGPDLIAYKELFISFELKNGHLIYRYNNGLTGGETVYSSEGKMSPLNDGKVHAVVKRKDKFTIDGVLIAEFKSSTQDLSGEFAYIGGVPFGHVMRSRFVCL